MELELGSVLGSEQEQELGLEQEQELGLELGPVLELELVFRIQGCRWFRRVG